MHPQSETIELWCNGNTTDSGPVFPGSSPGSSTEKVERNVRPFSFSPASLRPETIVRPTAIEFLVLLLQRHLPATPPVTLCQPLLHHFAAPRHHYSATSRLHNSTPLCYIPSTLPTSPLNSPTCYIPSTPPAPLLSPPCSATPGHESESAHYADLRADATPFASGCRSCTPQRLYP